MKVPPEIEAAILATPGAVVRTVSREAASPTPCVVAVTVPMRLPSLANSRMHWRALAALKVRQRRTVKRYLADLPTRPRLPAVVTLTRFGPQKLDDDNLAGAFKAVRDQVAEWLGVDDGSDRYRWEYRQERCKEFRIAIHVASV